MLNNKGRISIIMGVYNCEDTLSESIESLLNQTYTNWELILCEDGSSDNTYYIAKKYADMYDNIVLIRNKQNVGLAHSLNKCLEHTTGEYIARQDGDDRSLPERLEREAAVLNNLPEFDIVSTGMSFFDEKGFWGQVIPVKVPTAEDFVLQSPFCHAPSMFRKEAIMHVNGYDTDKRTYRAEDYDLWFRMYANGSKGCNIQEALYEVRDDRNAIKRRKYKYRINEAYVRYKGYRLLKLPLKSHIYAFRALIVGLVPGGVYKIIRRKKYSYS
jgi:glycosyltransferase EpsE